MFGRYSVPCEVNTEGLSLTIKESGGTVVYHQKKGDDETKKTLLQSPGEILIHPVEPVNKPNQVSSFLQIKFTNSVLVAPKRNETIFLHFPIEIGVFILRKDDHDLLDIISLAKEKYTLYGTPRGGQICRVWNEDLFFR